ncbi:MAG: hypothetical protein MR868_08625 [Lachnospiraceae bacterium]|nr:hypothetical protein [Lachnospiraceae bacterium]
MDEKNVTNRECMELLRKRMCSLFWKIAEEKENITIDGVWGYNEKAQFVGGKVINLCSYVALSYGQDKEEREQMLGVLSEIIDMCSGMKMETWGILNGLTGLYRLKMAGVYDQVVSRQTEKHFIETMDWHTFVDQEHDYALIHKPTNYYGVAFGIARWRELLGWDEMGSSAVLLDHLLNHISGYSGEYGFMDETKGEGRFDRYSILIPAEITELVLKTGWEEPELIRDMLGRSARIVLQMANEEGWGFSYGRSIGAYGEAAVLQILAAAVGLGGILTEEEEKLAYAYSIRCIRKMILFWYDEEMQSINMWNKGRRTDGYRNKNRILGENLSLSMQVIDVIEEWKHHGYDCSQEIVDVDAWKTIQDGLSFTRFAKNEYDRGLILYRTEGHVWSLPVISGGTPYFDKDAYLPVPRENGVLEAVPDVRHGSLVPKLVLEDGQELMPICFFDSIEQSDDHAFQMKLSQMCLIGTSSPTPRKGIEAVTTYRFNGREIQREDVFMIGEGVPLKEICLCFDTFSRDPICKEHEISFASGPILSIKTENYGNGTAKAVKSSAEPKQTDPVIDLSRAEMTEYQIPEDSFDTPHGSNNTQISWSRPWNGEQKLRLSWSIRF